MTADIPKPRIRHRTRRGNGLAAPQELVPDLKAEATGQDACGAGEDAYRVGKNSPPLHGRIKKGEVRNPNGRPKGSKNTKTLITEAFDQKVAVKGLPGKISLRHLAIVKLVRKAAEGDLRAFQALLQLEGYSPLAEAAREAQSTDNDTSLEKDRAILAFLNQEIRKELRAGVDADNGSSSSRGERQ